MVMVVTVGCTVRTVVLLESGRVVEQARRRRFLEPSHGTGNSVGRLVNWLGALAGCSVDECRRWSLEDIRYSSNVDRVLLSLVLGGTYVLRDFEGQRRASRHRPPPVLRLPHS